MKQNKKPDQPKAGSKQTNPFQQQSVEEAVHEAESEIHVYGNSVVCDTDSRGYATPENRDPLEIVVDASEGFIPLWAKGMTLRWRFQERSMTFFKDPEVAKAGIKELLGEALLAWGDAAPVQFTNRDDAWDFEIVLIKNDNCSSKGCVLAKAFFPDAGRHELQLYPKLFSQSRKEQVDTLIHEIGHIFGLRHFFAQLKETGLPSQIFGRHNEVSIMNYGDKSELTKDDKNDLKRLYQMAWDGKLTNINGTPIQFVKPFHTIGGTF